MIKPTAAAHSNWKVARWRAEITEGASSTSRKTHSRKPAAPESRQMNRAKKEVMRSLRPAATVEAKAPKVSLAIRPPCSSFLSELLSDRRRRSD